MSQKEVGKVFSASSGEKGGSKGGREGGRDKVTVLSHLGEGKITAVPLETWESPAQIKTVGRAGGDWKKTHWKRGK